MYKFFKSSNFPKNLIGTKLVLKRLRGFGEISKDIPLSDSTPSRLKDLKGIKRRVFPPYLVYTPSRRKDLKGIKLKVVLPYLVCERVAVASHRV